MKIIDRYILIQFIRAFLYAVLAFLIIFISIDLMENLGDFMDSNVPVKIIARYYWAFSPEIIVLMTPVSMLLAALFVSGRLTNQNELAAIKSSGISLYRLLAPFLCVACVVTLFSIYFNGWLVPKSTRTKFYIERHYLDRVYGNFDRTNMMFQNSRISVIQLGYYDVERKFAQNVSYQEFADSSLITLTKRFDAKMMSWITSPDASGDEQKGYWRANNCYERTFNDSAQSIQYYPELDMPFVTVSPFEIEKKQRRPDEMEYDELGEFIDNQEKAGINVARWLVDYHSKMALPFASIIVVLFGVPFSANRRRGLAVEFGVSMATLFIYLAFMKFSQVFGYNGDLNPIVTAWLANFVFLCAGIFNLARVNK